MLTHLSREQADVSQLSAIHRARWALEIQFRTSKQALNFDKALNRKSNEQDGRPPTRREDGTKDWKYSRTGKAEL
jgi:hypothetical protein